MQLCYTNIVQYQFCNRYANTYQFVSVILIQIHKVQIHNYYPNMYRYFRGYLKSSICQTDLIMHQTCDLSVVVDWVNWLELHDDSFPAPSW